MADGEDFRDLGDLEFGKKAKQAKETADDVGPKTFEELVGKRQKYVDELVGLQEELDYLTESGDASRGELAQIRKEMDLARRKLDQVKFVSKAELGQITDLTPDKVDDLIERGFIPAENADEMREWAKVQQGYRESGAMGEFGKGATRPSLPGKATPGERLTENARAKAALDAEERAARLGRELGDIPNRGPDRGGSKPGKTGGTGKSKPGTGVPLADPEDTPKRLGDPVPKRPVPKATAAEREALMAGPPDDAPEGLMKPPPDDTPAGLMDPPPSKSSVSSEAAFAKPSVQADLAAADEFEALIRPGAAAVREDGGRIRIMDVSEDWVTIKNAAGEIEEIAATEFEDTVRIVDDATGKYVTSPFASDDLKMAAEIANGGDTPTPGKMKLADALDEAGAFETPATPEVAPAAPAEKAPAPIQKKTPPPPELLEAPPATPEKSLTAPASQEMVDELKAAIDDVKVTAEEAKAAAVAPAPRTDVTEALTADEIALERGTRKPPLSSQRGRFAVDAAGEAVERTSNPSAIVPDKAFGATPESAVGQVRADAAQLADDLSLGRARQAAMGEQQFLDELATLIERAPQGPSRRLAGDYWRGLSELAGVPNRPIGPNLLPMESLAPSLYEGVTPGTEILPAQRIPQFVDNGLPLPQTRMRPYSELFANVTPAGELVTGRPGGAVVGPVQPTIFAGEVGTTGTGLPMGNPVRPAIGTGQQIPRPGTAVVRAPQPTGTAGVPGGVRDLGTIPGYEIPGTGGPMGPGPTGPRVTYTGNPGTPGLPSPTVPGGGGGAGAGAGGGGGTAGGSAAAALAGGTRFQQFVNNSRFIPNALATSTDAAGAAYLPTGIKAGLKGGGAAGLGVGLAGMGASYLGGRIDAPETVDTRGADAADVGQFLKGTGTGLGAAGLGAMGLGAAGVALGPVGWAALGLGAAGYGLYKAIGTKKTTPEQRLTKVFNAFRGSGMELDASYLADAKAMYKSYVQSGAKAEEAGQAALEYLQTNATSELQRRRAGEEMGMDNSAVLALQGLYAKSLADSTARQNAYMDAATGATQQFVEAAGPWAGLAQTNMRQMRAAANTANERAANALTTAPFYDAYAQMQADDLKRYEAMVNSQQAGGQIDLASLMAPSMQTNAAAGVPQG